MISSFSPLFLKNFWVKIFFLHFIAGMKTILAVAGCMIVLVAVVASVPLDSSKNHRSKESSLRNQLFDMASLNKRSMVNLPHPMRMQQPQEQPEEPEEWYPEEK